MGNNVRNSTQIQLLISANPHRWGSMDWRRFTLIREMQVPEHPELLTVGAYVARHNALGSVGTTTNARRYLRYMVERGQMVLPGVTVTRRAPRAVHTAIALPIAANLDDFTFGVEIECVLPRGTGADEVARTLTDAGIDTRIEHLSHGTRTWWKIVTDSSIGDYTRGREFVSPPLRGQDGLRQVEQVCQKLTALGCKVNKFCGLHVHVGNAANNNNAAYFSRMLTLYARNESTIDTLLAPSRRGRSGGHGFCNSVRFPSLNAQTVEEVCRSVGCTGARSSARYRKLNIDCWWSQRTIEFRQHQGSVDADKVCNWIQFCLHVAKFAASGAELPVAGDLPLLLNTLGLSTELQSFFVARAEYFAAREARALTQGRMAA